MEEEVEETKMTMKSGMNRGAGRERGEKMRGEDVGDRTAGKPRGGGRAGQ